MKTLNDKLIMITGAGGSIANAIEEELYNRGARLVLVDASSVRIQGPASSYSSLAIEADLSSLEGAQACMAEVLEKIGYLDGVIHLVGEVVTNSVLDSSEDDYNKLFDSNLRSLFNIVKVTLPELLKRKEAVIAGIASAEAWGGGKANAALFAAAKSAVATFLRSLDAELTASHVDVSILYPMGVVDTLSNRQQLSKDNGNNNLIATNLIAKTLADAMSCGDGGRLLELPVYPPR